MQHILGSYRLVALLICLTLGLAGCNSSSGPSGPDNQTDNTTDNPDPATATAAGNAQKGPFQPGGTAEVFRLQADGKRSDVSVSGDIAADGGFSLTDVDWTGPSELTMSGTYFNEFTGNFSMGSDGNATLHAAIVLPDDTDANVNLFTHFTAARIKHLMDADADFDDAREQARDELADIMGIDAAPISLDLRHDDGDDAHQDDSANLLLFSAASLAADADQAGIDAIAADFADDGRINGGGQAAFDAIKQATEDHPDLLATARTNLQNQYGVAPPDATDDLAPAWVPGAPAAPVATFITSGALEVGATQSFDARESTGDSLTYTWDFDDGDTATGAQTTHVYADAGTYTVTLTVTDEADRSDPLSRELTITAVATTPESPTASFSVGDNRVPDQELTFNAGDSMGASLDYAWTFGDGNVATGAEVTHAYTATGDYTVELTVTDSAGQTDQTTQTLAIIAPAQWVEQMVSGPKDSLFGSKAAIDGDTAVIGAASNAANRGVVAQGAAYVFTRAIDGTWSQQAKLTASGRPSYHYFGTSVAIDGNTIVIGADDKAYVFTRTGETWDEQAELTARDDGVSNDGFGGSIALSGDTIVVGARDADIGSNSGQGKVYVFTRAGGIWSKSQEFTANRGYKFGDFGVSVAIDGETLAVGSTGAIVNSNQRGQVYVFTRSSGTWSQQDNFWAWDGGKRSDGFGGSVALAGDTIVVGASGGSTGSVGDAYVFTRASEEWNKQQKLTPGGNPGESRFGGSISITSDTLVIGATATNLAQGAAYVFTRAGGVWRESRELTASDSKQNDIFGSSVTLSGDTVVVGAARADKAYFYSTSDLDQ